MMENSFQHSNRDLLKQVSCNRQRMDDKRYENNFKIHLQQTWNTSNKKQISNNQNLQTFEFQVQTSKWYKAEVDGYKKSIERKTKQITNSLNATKEQQLRKQIQQLKETIDMLERHLESLSQKYKQKSNEANVLMEQYVQLQQNYEHLEAKYINLDKKYSKKQQQFQTQYDRKIQNIRQQYSKSQLKLRSINTQMELKIKSMEAVHKNLEQQYKNIKQILSSETSKRRIKQEQNFAEIKNLKLQISQQNELITNLKRAICQKSKQIFDKNQCISSLSKSFKQINKRLLKTEAQNKKQIMKQRANTKKAMDGLQMTRKYSEIELNKSRKKQKAYIMNQKQLIGKIKQICNDQSMVDTTDKSSRKSQIKSLNTTLKDTKQIPQNFSPLVSNFIVQDQNIHGLSPIQKLRQKGKQTAKNIEKSFNGHNSSPLIITSKAKNKIDIQTALNSDYGPAGTPCFELRNNQKLFKATK